jgi:hypothetical protein
MPAKFSIVHSRIAAGPKEVSAPEISHFLQVQENQGIARRRTRVRRTSDSAD